MADFQVRDLDDEIAEVLRTRAASRGVSLEEEVRRTLTASVIAQQQEYVRRLRALQAAARPGNGIGAGHD
jgi:plasmid stability protein